MKSSFYRGQNCIDKLLSILREWTLWCYHEKQTFRWLRISKSTKNLCVSFKMACVVWDKTPVGAAILDLSKLSLYKFHYEVMIPRYTAARLKLAYKDTDSLLYCIETNDLYQDMACFKHLLDLSDYPREHSLYDPTNKKVLLTMTDELQGKGQNPSRGSMSEVQTL